MFGILAGTLAATVPRAARAGQGVLGFPPPEWLVEPSSATSLREPATACGLDLGVALTGWAMHDPALGGRCRALVDENFNLAVIEHGFYMSHVQPAPGVYDFATADDYYQFALANGQKLRGHALTYPGWATPEWVTQISDPAEMRRVLREHVTTLMARYPALAEVVAINEPYLTGHAVRALDPFHAVLGRESMALVIGALRDAHPTAIALYNDSLNHASTGVNGITTALTHENLAFLQAAGLIDERFRLGVQLHLCAHDLPEPADFQRTISGYRETFGCRVYVTEFDIDMSGFIGAKTERAAEHARITGDFLRAYLNSGVGRSFTVWGIGDAFSYLENELGLADADPTLFDEQLEPKPAVAEVARILEAVGP